MAHFGVSAAPLYRNELLRWSSQLNEREHHQRQAVSAALDLHDGQGFVEASVGGKFFLPELSLLPFEIFSKKTE